MDLAPQVDDMMNDIALKIWCEKHRPKTLDEIVLPADTRKIVESFKTNKELTNHLLLVSAPGQGKTSLAKIIVKDILDCDYLYINASDENGIDTIRTKVIGFAQTKSMDGQLKVVLLDEAEAISAEGQRALRNVMEEYSANTRFILTTNYKHKIIPAIQSRCVSLNFNHNIQDLIKHCYGILRKEGITLDDDQKKSFVELVKANAPDFRKTINELQRYSTSGKLEITSNNKADEFVAQVFEHVKQDVIEARRFVIQHESVFQSDYHNLLKSLLQHLYTSNMDVINKRESMLIITEYMYRHVFVADVEINFFACLINLNKVLA
jgi:DNA polymerase III delta prime subunit